MDHGHCCGRQFLTSEEKVEKLEEYKKWLDSESKGVEEAIQKIKEAANPGLLFFYPNII